MLCYQFFLMEYKSQVHGRVFMYLFVAYHDLLTLSSCAVSFPFTYKFNKLRKRALSDVAISVTYYSYYT